MIHKLFIVLWLNVLIFPTSNHHLPENRNALQVEERTKRFSIQPLAKMNSVLKNEEFKAGIPDLISNAGTITTLAKINYSGPPKQVFKDVGDACLGVIVTGLSMIPGGTVIGGIVSGIWGVFSPFLGSSAVVKSPMELMIDDIKDDIKGIKKDIADMKKKMNKMAKEIPEAMRKETDKKLSSLIERAIKGDLKRNQYVCNKYAIISEDFTKEMKQNKTVDESTRIEMIGLIHNCDNFLKDTAESFVYPEFADVLWVPSAMSTFVRVAFLSEVANYGVELKMDPVMIRTFWLELKKDINRHFAFSSIAVKRRQNMSMEYNVIRNFSDIEYTGCKMQSQLLYFDRQIYPHGIPQNFHISNESSELKVADFNVTGNNDPVHIQVYYNEIGRPHSSRDANGETTYSLTFLNCFMGPAIISRVPTGKLSMGITFVSDKTYLIRLLYFVAKIYYFNREYVMDSQRKVSVIEENENDLKIKIDHGKPIENRERFVREVSYHILECNWHKNTETSKTESCLPSRDAFLGNYVIETVADVNVEAGPDLKKNILIKENTDTPTDLILGLELIVLPKTK